MHAYKVYLRHIELLGQRVYHCVLAPFVSTHVTKEKTVEIDIEFTLKRAEQSPGNQYQLET